MEKIAAEAAAVVAAARPPGRDDRRDAEGILWAAAASAAAKDFRTDTEGRKEGWRVLRRGRTDGQTDDVIVMRLHRSIGQVKSVHSRCSLRELLFRRTFL